MHDQVQDKLMVARMTYFRTKWRQLPEAYARFLTDCLTPSAPVILVEDVSRWPVVRVGDRHVFQSGALEASTPYRTVDVLLFQDGVRSEGIAYPAQWLATARRHGATARLLAVDRSRSRHDIASLGRYGHVLAGLPPARHPWSPLDVGEAVQGLRTARLHTLAGPNA